MRFEGGGFVVGQVDVEGRDGVVDLGTAEAVVDLGHDRFAGQALAVGSGAHGVANLGGDDDVIAVGEVLQCAAQDLLAGALRVHVGGCRRS